MSALAEQICAQFFTYDEAGNKIAGSSFIPVEEGRAIAGLILQDPTIKRTMEIGCAQGVSSLFICNALGERGRHTIVDPFQKQDWGNAGRAALAKEGHTNFDFIEEESELLLPRLAKNGERFDLIFVDGNHTFEHTLIDLYFSTKLLRTGGYLIVDDISIPAVEKAIRYVEKFPCYERVRVVWQFPKGAKGLLARLLALIPTTPNMRSFLSWKMLSAIRKPRCMILRKIAEDQRHWLWFKPF